MLYKDSQDENEQRPIHHHASVCILMHSPTTVLRGKYVR